MYVNAVNTLTYGTILLFTIFLQNTPEGSIIIEGKLIYRHDGKSGEVTQPPMGVSFTSIRPEDRVFIKQLFRKNSRKVSLLRFKPRAAA